MNWSHWVLGSAFFAALTAILAKVGVEGVDSNVATALRTTVVVCFTWAIVLFSGVTSDIPRLSGRSVLFLVLSGLATGASWLCYFRALQLGEASQVAPVDKLSVVFVLLFAALFLGVEDALADRPRSNTHSRRGGDSEPTGSLTIIGKVLNLFGTLGAGRPRMELSIRRAPSGAMRSSVDSSEGYEERFGLVVRRQIGHAKRKRDRNGR